MDAVRYSFRPADRNSARWPNSKKGTIPTGRLSTAQLVRIWRDFTGFVQSRVPSEYLTVLSTPPHANLQMMMHTTCSNAVTLPRDSTDEEEATHNLRPKVSAPALTQSKAYQQSAIVRCLGQDWSARSKGASDTKTKPAAIGKVCAFDLVAEASAIHFTQCTFLCHAFWCTATFSPSTPLYEFRLHEEEPAHAIWLGNQAYAYKCRFGCATGFPHDLEQAVVRCYNESKKKKCKDTNSKYEQNVAVDLNYYTVHYETTHGKEQYFDNPCSLKCHNCELGFTSRAVLARHLTGALKQEAARAWAVLDCPTDVHQYCTLIWQSTND
ncbi:hypothetical protein KCU61_g2897, partial [Aureobasidium melanogenum]